MVLSYQMVSKMSTLKTARDRFGSVKAMASKAGVNPVTLGRWLNGERNPTVLEVGKVFDALGIQFSPPPDDLNIILQKERLLEDSYRKLLRNQFFYGFFTPFLLILIFTGICYLYIKEDTIIFLKNYGWIVVLFTFSQILSFISPIWHIKQYNDRLNAIEKKLKLNGKE